MKTIPNYALPIGSILSVNYEVMEFMGSGGFGITYKAKHRKLNFVYVIKEFFMSGKCVRNAATQAVEVQGISQKEFETFKTRFLDEAKTLAKFHENPNIVNVIDYVEQNETAYFVMPFVEGEDMAQYLAKQPNDRIGEAEAINYIHNLCYALQTVHNQNITHRDLKPANLLRTTAGKIVLIDFGAAKEFMAGGMNKTTTLFVSSGYAPPEQYDFQAERTVQVDIYAVGAILYRMLTGKTPLSAPQRFSQDLPEPQTLNPTISDQTNRVIMKAMALRAAQRQPNIGAFWKELTEKVQTPAAPTPPPVAKQTPAPPPPKASTLPPILQQLEANMVFIKGGIFDMGSEEGKESEKPVHKVNLSDFYMCKYQVTQKEWEFVMGVSTSLNDQNPSCFKGEDLPVERVSWNDVQEFIQKLNALMKQHGHKATYCLPSEAQWEYAAREGGKNLRFGNGKDIADAKEMNFNASKDYVKSYSSYSREGEYRDKTVPVNSFAPNSLGLYNMSGNVWEWCQDVYSGDYYAECAKQGTVKNPIYTGNGSDRVLRGGSWSFYPQYLRCADRVSDSPGSRCSDMGFRLSRTG